MPNLPVSVTRSDVVTRARSAIGQGKYKLGQGGRVPRNPAPFVDEMCDCSGFVAWCLGIDRYQPGKVSGGDWIETTQVYVDAQDDAGLFVRTMVPRPGDVIVYPDRKGKQGHIGVVSEVEDGKVSKVIHCASSNKNGAVQETGPDVFIARSAITARFKNYATDPACVGVK